MGGFFSSPKQKSRITETDRSILQIKLQRDQLVTVRDKLVLQHDRADITVRRYEITCSILFNTM